MADETYRDTQPAYGEHHQTVIPEGQKHLGPEVDALGRDKRRPVVGLSQGPSKGRQLLFYGLFLVITAAIVIGFKLAADELDKPPATNADVAPWSAPDAPNRVPLTIDEAGPPAERTGG